MWVLIFSGFSAYSADSTDQPSGVVEIIIRNSTFEFQGGILKPDQAATIVIHNQDQITHGFTSTWFSLLWDCLAGLLIVATFGIGLIIAWPAFAVVHIWVLYRITYYVTRSSLIPTSMIRQDLLKLKVCYCVRGVMTPIIPVSGNEPLSGETVKNGIDFYPYYFIENC
jgi:hypothetical protein